MSSLTFKAGVTGPEQVGEAGVVCPVPVCPRGEAHAPELGEVVQAAPAVGREGRSVRVSNGANYVNVLELHILGGLRDFVRPASALTGKLATSIRPLIRPESVKLTYILPQFSILISLT